MAENEASEGMKDEEALAYFCGLLRKRGIESLACPACGERDAWGGFADIALKVITDRNNEDPGPVILGSAHALSASCGRCGHMALFDRDVIGD